MEYTRDKLHIRTISTAGSVKLIANAKEKGLNVSCSVAIHHLFLSDETLQGFDTHYKVSPPLREKSDCKALIKGVSDGTIDFVTSDHIPVDIEHKRVEFDNAMDGTIGLESAFGCLNTLFGLDETITILHKGRSRFGLEEPTWKEGTKACLTLFDPDGDYTFGLEDVLSTSKNSMFLGTSLKRKAIGVINNDQIILK